MEFNISEISEKKSDCIKVIKQIMSNDNIDSSRVRTLVSPTEQLNDCQTKLDLYSKTKIK